MADCNCSCSCGENEGPRLVYSCSGASNVGQIANAAAVELTKRNLARMYCVVGVAAHIGGMVDSASGAGATITIDGCPTACVRMAMEHAGVHVDQALVVTDLGIKKNHIYEWTTEQVDKVINAVMLDTAETHLS